MTIRDKDIANDPKTLLGYRLEINNDPDGNLGEKIIQSIGESADLCHISPPVCVDNLGIYRKDMPQLSDEVVEQFINAYEQAGTDLKKQSIPVGMLKATQREINAEKVLRMKKGVEEEGWDLYSNPVIVSSDNYILDGHHRWAALLVSNPNNEMNVYKVDKPIRTILEDAANFKGVEQRDFGDADANKNATDNWNIDFFAEHPEKVMGVPYEASGRFGKVTKYRGSLADVENIPADESFVDGNKPSSPGASIINTDDKEPSLFTPLEEKNIERAIKKAPAELLQRQKAKKEREKPVETEPKPKAETFSFKEILDEYNPKVSEDELKVFVWYKASIGDPLGKKWNQIIDPSTVNKNLLQQWVNQGLLLVDGDQLVPEFIYFSGDVYKKFDRLEKNADLIRRQWGDKALEAQRKKMGELEQRMINEMLRISNDEDNPRRLVLVPINPFCLKFRIPTLADEVPFKIRASGKAKTKGQPDFDNPKLNQRWKTQEFKDMNLVDAFKYWMLTSKSTIRFKFGVTENDVRTIYLEGRKRRREEEVSAFIRKKARARAEGERLFNEFLATQLRNEDKERLEQTWNREFNSFREPDFDKVPVAFEMGRTYNNEFTTDIRPEKRDAVAFTFSQGSGCLAYGVGVGKTWAAIFSIAQSLDAGYCKRPFIVVPNQTYRQWLFEINALMPQWKVNGLYNLSDKYVNQLIGDSGIEKVPKGSVSVITYEGFYRIGFNEQTEADLREQLAAITDKKMEQSIRAREISKEKTLELVGRGLAGGQINIEDLGFDYITVDEAHSMKKVFTRVKSRDEGEYKGRVQYEITSGEPSTIALKGFAICQYILRNNKERNVLLLTATPFTNSPLEVFSMMSLIAYEKLVRSGLNNINDFFDNFVQTSYETVINQKLEPVKKQIFTGWNNLIALQRLIFRFIDYKGPDMRKFPDKYVIPYTGRFVDGEFVPVSDEESIDSIMRMDTSQAEYMRDIIDYVEGEGDLYIKDPTRSYDEKEEQAIRTLQGQGWARALALSPYLYQRAELGKPNYKEYVESSAKLRYTMECIKSVRDYHKKAGTPMSGQVIFMDAGVQYFPLIRQYLIKELGFDRKEVGIISAKDQLPVPKGTPKDKAKQAVQNAFLGLKFDGEELVDAPEEERIKVLIGSSSIREGINLQRKSSCLYNLYLPWNPTDNLQLEGRIWRQGNQFEAVRIIIPLLANSLDAFMFQKLEEKTARITAIFDRQNKDNILQIEQFNPAEIKMQLIRDPKIVAEMIIEEKKEALQEKVADLENDKNIAEKIRQYIVVVDNHAESVRESAKVFFPQKPGASPRALKTDLSLLQKLLRTKKDSRGVDVTTYEGRQPYVNVDYSTPNPIRVHDSYGSGSGAYITTPYWWNDWVKAFNTVQRQKEIFLDPKQIEANDPALQAYITQVNEQLKAVKDEISEIESQENKDQLTAKIVAERSDREFEPLTVSEAVSQFEKLNHLLDKYKLKKLPKKEPKKSTPSISVSESDAARARLRLRRRRKSRSRKLQVA